MPAPTTTWPSPSTRELCARVRAHLRSRERWLASAGASKAAASADTIDRLALAATSLWSVFQPVVDLATGEVIGHEALTRFADGTPPIEAFQAAHHHGLGRDLEIAAVASALAASVPLPHGHWLSVNLSPGVVLEPGDLADWFTSTARRVVIEITEHEPVHDYPRLAAALGELGPDVHIAIDDAGAGYSSLSHVLALRPDYVKLDRAWIADIDTDPARRALVAGMVDFAQESGASLIAEGVETRGELDLLSELGVELGQGYLLGRPVAAAR